MKQFIPVENDIGKISRGYAENKPFDKCDTYWVTREEIESAMEIKKEIELRKEIASIVNCVKDISSRADWATDELVELFKEWKDK